MIPIYLSDSMKKSIESTVKHDGFSTISIKVSDLKKLWIFKRWVGARSLHELLSETLECPELLAYMLDRHKGEAFDIKSIGLTSRHIQLAENKFLVKTDE